MSQPFAGAFLNAVPSRHWFRLETRALRIAVQRRVGLPISDGLSPHLTSSKGKPYDALGDVAQNDGLEGHAHRHSELLQELVRVTRSVWGARVQLEPEDYSSYSDYRPDMAAPFAGESGSTYIGELKFIDPLSSDPANIDRRGGFVCFGNTEPPMREKVFGRDECGEPGTRFDPHTGTGYVSGVSGDYDMAQEHGCEVWLLLFETFGGFGGGVLELLQRLAGQVNNRLSHAQYDETSWSARNWKTYQTQRMSVALHKAAAYEISHELGFAAGRATGSRDQRAV